MKKVLFLSLFVASAVLAACLLPRNNSSLEGLAKANVEALASVPAYSSCKSGGLGADECAHSLYNNGQLVYSCNVKCGEGYYACCLDNGCICISYLD